MRAFGLSRVKERAPRARAAAALRAVLETAQPKGKLRPWIEWLRPAERSPRSGDTASLPTTDVPKFAEGWLADVSAPQSDQVTGLHFDGDAQQPIVVGDLDTVDGGAWPPRLV